MIRIGIPRAMSYYYLYPFFKTLLVELGAEVILSDLTTKTTMENLSACPTDEPCVAVKLCFAHVQQLMEKDCEYILLPKVIRVNKNNFCCPKFIGIPDMIKAGLQAEARILSPKIDLGNKKEMLRDFKNLAASLGKNKGNLLAAIQQGLHVQNQIDELMVQNQWTVEEAYMYFENQRPRAALPEIQKSSLPTIALIGHPYVLYEWVSHDLLTRLRYYGRVITPEMVDKRTISAQMKKIYEGEKLWSYEAQMLGAGLYLMENRLVDRVVFVGLFECGPASIIEPYIEDMAERMHIPLLKLFMDEQTGEAGLITRIEAFMDTSIEPYEIVLPPVETPSKLQPLIIEKPVVGFPSMGRLDRVIGTILTECGVATINPPSVSRRSIELGKELVPEFVCLPLTATLGQMIEMTEMGVNTFLMVGGKGICRLGWYGQIQDMLLRKKGISFDMTILDSPFPLRKNGPAFIDSVKKVTNNTSWTKIGKSLWLAYQRLSIMDEAEGYLRKYRAYEVNRGQSDQIFSTFEISLDNASSYKDLLKVRHTFIDAITAVPVEDTEPLRIALVGEIWVLLEPFVNLDIERFLGLHPHVRVWIEREISLSHWLQSNLFHTPRGNAHTKAVHKAAAPYLSEEVGGHGIHSVGLSVLASQQGMDGVIHLMPFTCMPEIVAQNILSQVQESLHIPILSLIISDQTGEAGFETRLDAFLDLLLESRYKKSIGGVEDELLYWH